MESTGVYWKPLFSHLISKGFEVYLVNATHVKNVAGRKDDESDAMWLQKLHSSGLLRSSYLPDEDQEKLRTIVRFQRNMLEDSSRFINCIQKSLELMNIKFHTIIRDITEMSGMAVLKAILDGERNPANFLPLLDYRIKADREVRSSSNHWKANGKRSIYSRLDKVMRCILTIESKLPNAMRKLKSIYSE